MIRYSIFALGFSRRENDCQGPRMKFDGVCMADKKLCEKNHRKFDRKSVGHS